MAYSSFFAHLYTTSPEENSSSKALSNPTKHTHSNKSELHLKTLAFTSLIKLALLFSYRSINLCLVAHTKGFLSPVGHRSFLCLSFFECWI